MIFSCVYVLFLMTLPGGHNDQVLKLRMPGAHPLHRDSYLCSSFDVIDLTDISKANSTTLHITGFLPNANPHSVHHMLLFSCAHPVKPPGGVYNCVHHNMCRGSQSILYAWAQSAPSTILPDQVSFTINPSERRFLVLQAHYAHSVTRPDYSGLDLRYQKEVTRFAAGIFILLRSGLHIPPNKERVVGDVNCRLPSPVPITVFAFRTHAHALSTVISGYRYRHSAFSEIAKGSPQWPQTFYSTDLVRLMKILRD